MSVGTATVPAMNRTDRLYAVVEDLRAIAPRRRTARQLAERYEVSVRTIERDISALQQAGVPIYADTGRLGGYALDRSMTLPPLNFTPAEAVAVSVALRGTVGSPFANAAQSALNKIIAAMPAQQVSAAHELAGRVCFLPSLVERATPRTLPLVIEEAVAKRHVLRLTYRDKHDQCSERTVEPTVFLATDRGWYLYGWCRLRSGMRAFRLDRIMTVHDTGVPAPTRQIDDVEGYNVQTPKLA
jgi:predicted DNA-binding transcriptional regulator YafY